MAENKENQLNIVLDANFDGEGGGRHEFSQKSVIIGSGPAANLRIEDDSVSSIHAIFKAGETANTALVSDLGSETGTVVNGKEIRREAVVKRGDIIKLGEVEIYVMGMGADEVETKVISSDAADTEDTKVEVPPEKKRAAGEDVDRELKEILDDEMREDTRPIERPPELSKKGKRPPRPAPKARAAKDDPRTAMIRRREIPRSSELAGAPSGQSFFERELPQMERPREGYKLLEVKVMWGGIVLDARQFAENQQVTVGDNSDAGIQITTDRMGGESFILASPGGTAGHVVHVASGMDLQVRRSGKPVDVDELPSEGAVRTYPLQINDKCRVMVGQLAFVIQYVSPARGITSGVVEGADFQMSKWFAVFLVIAAGLWMVVQMTPKIDIEVSDYLKNPARFAKLIMPTTAEQEKKSFEEIKKKKEEKSKVDDTGKWEKVQTKYKEKDSKDVPREVKEKQDRKIATSAGILGLLKGRGGGTGDNASSVFGGSAMTNLDQQLAGLTSTGMQDSGGFGGLGTRGGGPGGGGGGLGLGGLGTAGYGRGSGRGYGSVKIGHRGKHAVRVVKGRTRVIGGLSQEVVGRYIKRYWAQFKYCYERELTKDPNLYGKITTTFTIAGNGRVSEAQVIQTTMHNANVEECVLRVVRRIRFPAPKGGGQVIVTYPFMFTTAG